MRERDVDVAITDPAVLDAAAETMGGEMTLWRGEPAELSEAGGTLVVTAGSKRKPVVAVLVAVGRRPNLDDMGLENLGTPLRDDGVPAYDAGTLQVGRLPIFIAGDANTDRPVLHEAWDDGRVAGYNAVAERPASFKRRTPLHVVFSDPNIAAMPFYHPVIEEGLRAALEGLARMVHEPGAPLHVKLENHPAPLPP